MNPLVSSLTSARARSRPTLSGVDLSTIANRAGTRRIQDVLAHIASWEREVATSIRAGLEGREHTLTLPLELDEQNERYHAANADLTADAALAMWDEARRELAEAVGRAAAEATFMCPWGKVETVDHVVKDMIEHEATHMRGILAVLEGPG